MIKKNVRISIILLSIMLFIAGGSVICAQTTGDANGDSQVNIIDALMTAQYYVGLNPAGFDAVAADVDCSGSANIIDALTIAQYYVGLIPGFPCAPPTNPPSTAYCNEIPEPVVPGSFQVLNPGSSSTIYTSDHFAVRWNASDNVSLSSQEVQEGLNSLERVWDKYINQIGFQPPYWDTSDKYKVSVNVSDQGWATGAGTGDRDPAMWLHFNAFRDTGTLAHEFAHTLQYSTRGMRDSDFVGWSWESHAEWMTHQFVPDNVNCAEMLVNAPHIYYGSTRNRYCNWQFWEFLKDRFCYKVLNDIWSKAKKPGESGYRDEDPFTTLARNMNWSVEQLNDIFGVWAMHNATWDYSNGSLYRREFGPYTDTDRDRHIRVTVLEELDAGQRRYAVPDYWAPQRWGYNLVRLVPDNPGADSNVTVTFRGVIQTSPGNTYFGNAANVPSGVPDPHPDWRWGLVAKDSSGNPRYSSLQKGSDGQVSFNVMAGDSELWLVVVGTPSRIHQVFWDQMYFSIYRYPWMVQFQGAWPHGYEPNASNPGEPGSPHPNGGGWVANTAQVSSSVYVGPRAKVLGNARVTGNARIEDWATISGSANVRDNAVIRDFAYVYAGQVYEDAHLSALTIVGNNQANIHGSASVATVMNTIGGFELSGNVILIGDIELHVSLNSGVYYGFVDEAVSTDPGFGADRTDPVAEVTATGPYIWRY